MPSSREASSTARRKEPSCCVSAARKRLPKAIPLSSSLFSVANRCEKSFTSAASPSASTVSALRISPGAGTSSAMRTLPVERPESVTAIRPVMSSVWRRSPAMTVGAPRPPPTQTTFSPLTGRWWQICAYLEAAGVSEIAARAALGAAPDVPSRRRLPSAPRILPAMSRPEDLVVLADLDPVTFRCCEDLLSRRLLGARGLELGLVPPRHRVPHVRLVVDGEVAFTASVHVRELPFVELLPVLGVDLCHCVAPFRERTLHNSDPATEWCPTGARNETSGRLTCVTRSSGTPARDRQVRELTPRGAAASAGRWSRRCS